MRNWLVGPLLALGGCAYGVAPVGDEVDARADARIDAPIDAPSLQTITLSQASNPNVEPQASVACTETATGVTRENSYYRVFRLADFGVTRPFTPSMVSFGVELATAGGGGPGQTVQVKLHTLNGPLQVASLVTVATNSALVPNSSISMVDVPIAPQPRLEPGATLVAEVFVPDAMPVGHILFVGANTGSETAPGYLRAPMCSLFEPTTYANVGFPAVRLLLTVTGTY